jgi:hypothetical protein
MGFGCKADGSSDDQPCFQAAVNAASFLNLYGTTYYGSEVFVPCGKYALGSPIVIPRGGGGGLFSYGTGNAVVSIRGDNKACSQLQGLSSFTKGITGIAITNIGSGYTSAPTITLSGGGASTQGTVTTSIFNGALNTAFLSTVGSGYTSMPTCVVSGGGGTGAACMAVGHAMIETGRTAVRLVGMSLQDLSFSEPAVQGTMGFHHWMVNAENTSGGTSGGGPVAERIEGGVFRNLIFYGDNGNTPADIYIAGDCEACVIDNVSSDASKGTSDNYETVAVMTDICVNGAMANESCGLQIGSMSNITAGGTRGGYVASFQGRFMREDFRSSFSNGLHGGLPNSVCYLFENSIDSVITNVANEGNGEAVQIELVNSRDNYFTQWGLGAPNSQGAGTGNGLVLVNSSDNVFETNEPSSIFGSSFLALGGHAILTDSNSHGNRFLNTQLAVATDYSISDLNTNFIQYCDASGGDSACLAGTFLTDGVMPGYVSSVAVPATSSSSCIKGQSARSQQYTYYCYASNSWVRAPMSSF